MTGLYHKGVLFPGTTFELYHDGFVDDAGDPFDWSGYASDDCDIIDSTGTSVASGTITFPAAGAALLTFTPAETTGVTGDTDVTLQARIASALKTLVLFYGDLRAVAGVTA